MNYDTLQRFPNQDIENRKDECVGETVADLIGNLFGTPMDAGFNYATALYTMRSVPTTMGSDPYVGMLGGVVYGSMPTDKVPFDINLEDELYESNFANYPNWQDGIAFAQNGVRSLHTYGDIVNYLLQYKQGVQLAVKWYESFNTPNQDGTLPAALGKFSFHCTAVYESTPKGLRMKPWLGPGYGDKGYCYMSESNFGLTFQSAAGFDPSAWRWLQLATAACSRPWLISDILPQLKS